MKQSIKRMGALALSLGLSLSLAACGGESKSGLSKDDVIEYVNGIIEENYLGSAGDTYKSLVLKDDADIEETYEISMSAAADLFLNEYSIESPTNEIRKEVIALCKDIYSHTKFEVVSAAQQDDGSFSVKVNVEPIDVYHLVQEDLETALEPWYTKYPTEVQDTMSDEEFQAIDAEWADIIIDTFRSKLSQISNLDAQSITVGLEQDENGYYILPQEEFNRIDALIIDYPVHEHEEE